MFEKYAEEYAKNSLTPKENEVISTVDRGVESLSPDKRHLWQCSIIEGIIDRQKARKEGFLKVPSSSTIR